MNKLLIIAEINGWAMKLLCIWGILAQSAAVFAAEAVKPDKPGKEVYSLSFDDPKSWKLEAHVNEVPAGVPEGVKMESDAKYMCDGKPGLRLNYSFPTKKHDAVMLTSDVSIPGGTWLGLNVYGDGSKHELFVVLTDKSGEAHYLPIGPVDWQGWKTVYKSLAALCKGPPNKWYVTSNHWGGDKTQTLEFPITRITVGLNDKPDEFQGKGEIGFGWLKVYKGIGE